MAQQVHRIDTSDNIEDIVTTLNEQCISEMSPPDLSSTLEKWEDKWTISDSSPSLDFNRMLGVFDIQDSMDIDHDTRDVAYAKQKQTMGDLLIPIRNRISSLKCFDWPNENTNSLGERINRAISTCKGMTIVLVNLANMSELKRCPNTDIEFDQMNITGPMTYVDETTNVNDYQNAILFVLQHLKDRGYKRYRQMYVCKQIKNTRAWEKISQIGPYIETLFQKEGDFDMWAKFTKNGSTRKNLTEHISCCVDPQFPELVKNRHVFSYSNGLYVCRDINGTPRFYPYESDEFKRLDPRVVSSKYFDVPFDDAEYDDWYDIPTPNLDKILDYQKFPPEVIKCILYFIGRMLYDVNDMEKWQVVPFLKGMASTGKGKLCEIASYFYENEDVGTLSDNPEKQFGLSAIFDKFCFVAPEITSRFGLSQADFQSMVSGENVSIGIKFKTAESVEWKVPGMFAGNEPPGYHDNSGSIQRRLVTIPFPHQVRPQDIDTELPAKLRAEVPHIMRKANEAYHWATKKFIVGGLWAYLPPLITKTRDEMALSTNALRHYLAEPNVAVGADKEIPLSLFIQHFNEHCKANNLGRHKFTPDFYNGPFSAKGINVETKSIVYKGNQKPYQRHQIVVGLDVISEDDGFFSADH